MLTAIQRTPSSFSSSSMAYPTFRTVAIRSMRSGSFVTVYGVRDTISELFQISSISESGSSANSALPTPEQYSGILFPTLETMRIELTVDSTLSIYTASVPSLRTRCTVSPVCSESFLRDGWIRDAIFVCSRILLPISRNFKDSAYFKDSSSWRIYPMYWRDVTRRCVVLL